MVAQLLRLQQPQQLLSTQPLPGQHLSHHTVDPRLHEGRLCGLLTRGIFFPPSLLQAQQEGSRTRHSAMW